MTCSTMKSCDLVPFLLLLIFRLTLVVSVQVGEDRGGRYDSSGRLSSGVYKDDWIPTSPKEAINYYAFEELCQSAVGGCGHHYAQLERIKERTYGLWRNGNCGSYEGMRLRHKTTQPTTMDSADVVTLMRKRNSTLMVFIGDSMTGAHFTNTERSFVRYGFQVDRGVKDNQHGPGVFSVVTLPSSADVIMTMVYKQYTGERGFDVVMKETRQLLEHFSRSLLFFNFGLHFSKKSQELYVEDMGFFLRSFANLTIEGHTIFYKETSAQHFPSANGLFSFNEHAKLGAISAPVFTQHKRVYSTVNLRASRLFTSSNGSSIATDGDNNTGVLNTTSLPDDLGFRCVPIANESMADSQNWQNKAVKKLLSATAVRVSCPSSSSSSGPASPAAITAMKMADLIDIAPFFEYSAARYDYHLDSLGDCTHFCDSPMMYLPLWESVYRSYKARHFDEGGNARVGLEGCNLSFSKF